MPDQPAPPATPAPLQLDPADVVAELEAIPEARPYWLLAQERAGRKMLARLVQEQEQELQELRNEKARRDRLDADPGAEQPDA